MSLVAFASLQKLLRQVARVAIVCLCAALVLPPVRADDSSSSREPPAEALEHYNLGRAHYQAGRYEQAVVELERALELDPDSPNLVYNLARVYELQGEIERSIAYYRRYHGMLPPSEVEERERVAGTIQRLEGARRRTLRKPETRAVPSVVATERGVADAAFWTLASLSLAALITGAVTGGLALRAEHQTQAFVLGRDGGLAARNDQAHLADRLALVSDVSVATGAVGALTSVLLYALRSRPPPKHVFSREPSVLAPGLTFSQHGMTLSLRGQL